MESTPLSCRYLDLGSYAEWDEDKRIEFLTAELEGKRPLIPAAMPMTNDVREVGNLWLSSNSRCLLHECAVFIKSHMCKCCVIVLECIVQLYIVVYALYVV